MNAPIICFGQQPCGFFPKRYLIAKINTARKLREEIGGKVVFFYHDSDADYRETITIMKDGQTGAEVRLNFTQENKLQKKHSPLYLKRIPTGWKEETLKQLPRFVAPSPLARGDAPSLPTGQAGAAEGQRGQNFDFDSTSSPSLLLARRRVIGENLIDIFKSVEAKTVADFCLEMYKKMGLLDGIEIVRSSDKNFRQWAFDIVGEYFADIPYQSEVVRAKIENDKASLHEGGGKFTYFDLPDKIFKQQINPGRDERFGWMNSVIHSTHYIAGNSEYEYIRREEFPEVKFIKREDIENQNEAWLS